MSRAGALGGKRLGFADYEQATVKKRTKKEKFLSEMDQVVPRQLLLDLIEPVCPKVSCKVACPSYSVATMLRIHLMEQWYNLSDPAMGDALIEVPAMRHFAGIDLISDRLPDETTIRSFLHLIEKHVLGKQIFEMVSAYFKQK